MSRDGDRRLLVLRTGEKPGPGEEADLSPKQLFLKSIEQQLQVYDGAVVIFTKGAQIGDIRGLVDDYWAVYGVLAMAPTEFQALRRPLMFDSDE